MDRARVASDVEIGEFEQVPIGTDWGAGLPSRLSVGIHSNFVLLGWGFVLLLGATDFFGAELSGLSFVNWRNALLSVGFLAAIGLAYDYSGRNQRLADVGNYAALWVAFSAAGSIFTYVVATMRLPLCDARLSSLDAALGFHWTSWFYCVAHHPFFKLTLTIAYASMLPQIVGSILYFAHTHQTNRNREFLAIAMISLVTTTLISGLLPATGPFLPGHQPEFSKLLITIRAGSATIFSLDDMQGIVTMPSYHTVIAMVLIWVHRPPSRSFSVAAILNSLMLLAVPSAGNHYLSDMLAGAVVAAGSIALVTIAFQDRRVAAQS
jgi:hypothetical protein